MSRGRSSSDCEAAGNRFSTRVFEIEAQHCLPFFCFESSSDCEVAGNKFSARAYWKANDLPFFCFEAFFFPLPPFPYRFDDTVFCVTLLVCRGEVLSTSNISSSLSDGTSNTSPLDVSSSFFLDLPCRFFVVVKSETAFFFLGGGKLAITRGSPCLSSSMFSPMNFRRPRVCLELTAGGAPIITGSSMGMAPATNKLNLCITNRLNFTYQMGIFGTFSEGG